MSTVLHVLDHSRPVQSGYASRSHSILRSLKDAGYRVLALTGPRHDGPSSETETIDGVTYVRSKQGSDPSSRGVLGQLSTVATIRRNLKQVLGGRDIGLVHAHSPCLNGLAVYASGVPFVYEMRSSWEDAAVSEGVTTTGSARYRASRALETFTVNRASHTFVICEGLRRELTNRGVQRDKITVVPNALQEAMFETCDESNVRAVVGQHSLEGRRVIGYFGSFFDWEGVDTLVKALPSVLRVHPNAVLLLAGSGRTEPNVRNLVEDLGLAESVVFAGRIDAAEMAAYYKVADVVAYPRVANRLTEMVTPLKPLEAMAQGTPVIASDIGGHRELIEDGVTGFLYNPKELRRACIQSEQRPCGLSPVHRRHSKIVCEARSSMVGSRRKLPVRLRATRYRSRLVQ